MRRLVISVLCALTAAAALAVPAAAQRTLITTQALHMSPEAHPPIPPPIGTIEGACGVAVAGGTVYVSDYYHRVVDAFSAGSYLSQIAPAEPLDGPCGLATGPGGALYANYWHRGVLRLLPSEATFDTAHSTGVAVDPVSGDVYADDRTYVAVYQPSGAPVEVIGAGALGDAYGVAVHGGRVYVADAASGTVKVFEPAGDPATPVAELAPPGGFTSLIDSSLAVDPAEGHLLVLDDLQPGWEHPEAAIDEFSSAGAYLGGLGARVIDAEPSGIAVSGEDVYVTSGNGAGANLYEFGPYVAAGFSAFADEEAAGDDPASPSPMPSVTPRVSTSGDPVAHASQVVQSGGVRAALSASFAPRRLPREGLAPIRLAVGMRLSAAEGGTVPQLRRIEIAINREGRLDPVGLPVCPLSEIEPATTEAALASCRRSLIGEGHFAADVGLSRQSPFPQAGKLYAFNGRLHGHPAILAHVYGTDPVPTSYTLPFEIGHAGHGAFGVLLRAKPPRLAGSAAITRLSLDLGRSFRFRGSRRSYLAASCPAPAGFPGAVFTIARVRLSFAGGRTLTAALDRSCRAAG
ncbi:MAG TPA: hypothetical protein VMH33_09320 [Solirubrobacterales bacterium]|nr:hypothetical protein [Solirubrobacterales bacterium]